MPTIIDRRQNGTRTRNKPSSPGMPFQPTLEKDQAGGYAGLDSTTKLIPTGELGTGVPDATKALFGNQSWVAAATSAALAAEAATRATDDATEAAARAAADALLQLKSEKNAASGYAGLDASSKLTGSQQTYGSAANTACQGNDSRLSDSRAPNGAATGDLAGSYPAPTIAALAVTDAKVAAANKDGAAGTASMRTLGTGAAQACAGNDSRLSDSRAPNGSASGDLSGTYPSPTVKSAAAQFVINGRTDSTTGVLQNIFADNAARSTGYQSEATRTNASTHVQFINPNGVVGSISTSGSTTTYATSSDRRLKTPIRILTESTVIGQIKVREFERDGEIEYGVFAQELHKLLCSLGLETKARHAVHVGSNHKDKDGRLRNPWGVDFSALVPDLILECQSLRRAVVALEARVATLTPATP